MEGANTTTVNHRCAQNRERERTDSSTSNQSTIRDSICSGLTSAHVRTKTSIRLHKPRHSRAIYALLLPTNYYLVILGLGLLDFWLALYLASNLENIAFPHDRRASLCIAHTTQTGCPLRRPKTVSGLSGIRDPPVPSKSEINRRPSSWKRRGIWNPIHGCATRIRFNLNFCANKPSKVSNHLSTSWLRHTRKI